jgi:hypothetical protein
LAAAAPAGQPVDQRVDFVSCIGRYCHGNHSSAESRQPRQHRRPRQSEAGLRPQLPVAAGQGDARHGRQHRQVRSAAHRLEQAAGGELSRPSARRSCGASCRSPQGQGGEASCSSGQHFGHRRGDQRPGFVVGARSAMPHGPIRRAGGTSLRSTCTLPTSLSICGDHRRRE